VAFDPGSFRDPDSRVFYEDGQVFRRLSAQGVKDYEAFAATPLAADAAIVKTTRVGADLLEHERIPFVSYPYEWSFEMLRAAAGLQLRLLEQAIPLGLSLKDATPYNVQWRHGRPVFVDVGSFEPLRPDEPWIGYRQFCCLYLYPLMLTAYRGVPFQPFLRGSLEGIEPEQAAALLPHRRRGVSVNARLLARLERKAGATSARETTGRLARAGFRPEIVLAQIRRLRRLVDRLEAPATATAWSRYEPPYSEADLAAKRAFVERAAERVKPGLAWDLGANTGAFAALVAPHAGLVVAMEADPVASGLPEGNVLPLVVDLCDPSPARGWALAERAPLLERGRPDLTLSLALVHHLAITRTIPAAAIVDWLHGLGGAHVIEVPHRDDPRVQQLLDAKRDGFPYEERAFEAAIRERFEVVEVEALATRTLFEVR
jgi:hypothetical protein